MSRLPVPAVTRRGAPAQQAGQLSAMPTERPGRPRPNSRQTLSAAVAVASGADTNSGERQAGRKLVNCLPLPAPAVRLRWVPARCRRQRQVRRRPPVLELSPPAAASAALVPARRARVECWQPAARAAPRGCQRRRCRQHGATGPAGIHPTGTGGDTAGQRRRAQPPATGYFLRTAIVWRWRCCVTAVLSGASLAAPPGRGRQLNLPGLEPSGNRGGRFIGRGAARPPV